MVEEKKLILGLSGLAGCGKDHTANILVEKCGFVKVAFADPLKRICREVFDFSEEQLWGPSQKRNELDQRYPRGQHTTDPVGGPCTKCGLVYSRVNSYIPCALTPRSALQQLGTEWGRNCYENVWVDYALRVANLVTTIGNLNKDTYSYSAKNGLTGPFYWSDVAPAKGVVIPDVRFKNELDALHKAGAKVVRINRDQRTTLTGAQAAHASEKEQQKIPDSEFDYVFHNIEDPAQLIISIKEMMIVLTQ